VEALRALGDAASAGLRQSDAGAGSDVVVELFHQHPLAAGAVEVLQQQRTGRALRWFSAVTWHALLVGSA
jgi:hypothetical protein